MFKFVTLVYIKISLLKFKRCVSLLLRKRKFFFFHTDRCVRDVRNGSLLVLLIKVFLEKERDHSLEFYSKFPTFQTNSP